MDIDFSSHCVVAGGTDLALNVSKRLVLDFGAVFSVRTIQCLGRVWPVYIPGLGSV